MNKLNEEQFAAVNAKLGSNLIIASAGTGKTSTIVARIEKLLNDGAKPNTIMLLTFTNKAAKEMMARLEKKLGSSKIKGIISGTFHAISLEYLKKHKEINLKKNSELRALLKSIYEKYNPNRDDLFDYSYLADIYSRFNNTNLVDDFRGYLKQNYEEQSDNINFYCKVLDEFNEQKKAHNYYDFDDLLLNAKDFFKNDYKDEPFYEVLVDEYQDTNNLQSAILDAIPKKSLFCVGDYDQSIYAFNGANIEIIGSFKDRYKNANIYSLNKNYRSLSNILEFANRVITKNERLYPKELIVTRDDAIKPIKLHSFNLANEQYEFIANDILAKLQMKPKSDIAVIYRNNSSGDLIERSLKLKGIKVARKGGTSFYELKEINTLINLANLTNKNSDILSFLGILLESKGVGNAKVNIIYKAFLELGNGSLLEGILRPIKKDRYDFLAKSDEAFGLFASTQNEAKQNEFSFLASDFKHNPVLLLKELKFDNVTFLEELYKFLKENENIDNPSILLKNAYSSKIFSLIINNIAAKRSFKGAKIVNEIKEQKLENIKNNCKYILEDAKNYSTFKDFYEKTILNIDYESTKGVQLLTVHASKGLEFEIVYLIDLAQGRFPNLKLSKSAGGIDEERRLFYVALTRAKDELIMSWAKRQSEDDKNDAIRSIFIDEGKKPENI